MHSKANGKWHMNVTYTGCVHTLNNDLISVEKKYTTFERMIKTTVPFWIATRRNKNMVIIIRELQEKLKDVVTMTLKGGNKHCRSGILHYHLCLLFLSAIKHFFKLWG